MSTKVVRCLADFVRHGMDIDVECRCGHKAALDARWVYGRFKQKGWYTGLHDGYSLGSPYSHFYCTRCFNRGRGIVRPKHIGPHYR